MRRALHLAGFFAFFFNSVITADRLGHIFEGLEKTLAK